MSKVPTSNDIMERDDLRVRYATSRAESGQCRQTINDGIREFVAGDFLCVTSHLVSCYDAPNKYKNCGETRRTNMILLNCSGLMKPSWLSSK